MSVALNDLPHIVHQLTPHVCTDETLPVLHGIYLEATGTHLFAAATDRFTFALARREAADTQPWRAIIARSDLVALRAMFPTRRRPANLTLDYQPPTGENDPDGRLTVSDRTRSLRLSANTPLASLFPKWRPLFATALSAEPQLADETHLNATMLSRWAHAPVDRYDPLTIWSAGTGKPLLVAAGHAFLGLQMPVRRDEKPGAPAADRRDRTALRTTWTDTLTTAPPAAKRLRAA